MIGKIIHTNGVPVPHSYFIQGEDSKIYFAHMGDLLMNEYAQYSNQYQTKEALSSGDLVEFDIPIQKYTHVIHVKKITHQ